MLKKNETNRKRLLDELLYFKRREINIIIFEISFYYFIISLNF